MKVGVSVAGLDSGYGDLTRRNPWTPTGIQRRTRQAESLEIVCPSTPHRRAEF